MLTLTDLTADYDGIPALRGVSNTIQTGEIVGLIGPNGAGKSTLLRVISRILKPRSGQIQFEGQDIWQMPPRDVARRLALVEQATKLVWPYTVEQVIRLGRFPHQGWFAPLTAQDRRIIEAVIAQNELEPFRDRPLNTLSAGERQRALTARALVQQPRLLLLDEPTSNLDLNYQHRLLNFIQTLVVQDNLTVVVVLHDLALAARYCGRLLLFDQGCLRADGPPEAVLSPDLLASVFGVAARLYRDPINQHWALSIT
jgi:iron complex transport system ATP-binding protein